MRIRRSRVTYLAIAALVVGGITTAIPNASAQIAPDLVTELPRPVRQADSAADARDTDSVLVRFKKGASTTVRSRAVTSRGAVAQGNVAKTGYVKVNAAGNAEKLLAQLRKDPAVESATLNYRRGLFRTPNDPYYASQQQYLSTVRLPQAWDRIYNASTQIIAIVDTGVDTNHPDLAGKGVTGYNAVNPGSSTGDPDGHGTMVAGIAAANTGNSVGVAGAAWNGRIMPIRVFSGENAFDADIAKGITWAVDHGAKIVNLSLGGPGDSPALHSAITYAVNKGAVVVAASGNDGDGTPQYPAAYPEVIAVGATDESGRLTDFSSSGHWLDLAAPGFNIVSTHPGALGFHYGIGDGTSFSAPLVSGTAALVRAAYPTLTPAEVADRLRQTARDAGPRGIDPYYGYGVLDAFHAVGGTFGPEFAQPALGSGEPNDVPARAVTLTGSATGTYGIEGDVDWYRFDESIGHRRVMFTVTAAGPYNPDYPQNGDHTVEVYDSQLRRLASVDAAFPGQNESVEVEVETGTYYVKVRSFNGAADSRPYSLSVGDNQFTGTLLGAPQLYSLGSPTWQAEIGDVTGDGRNDVVVTTGSTVPARRRITSCSSTPSNRMAPWPRRSSTRRPRPRTLGSSA